MDVDENLARLFDEVLNIAGTGRNGKSFFPPLQQLLLIRRCLAAKQELKKYLTRVEGSTSSPSTVSTDISEGISGGKSRQYSPQQPRLRKPSLSSVSSVSTVSNVSTVPRSPTLLGALIVSPKVSSPSRTGPFLGTT